MRRFCLFLILAAAYCMSGTAQVQFGVKGGVNVTHMSLSRNVFDKGNRAGFYIGPTVKASLLDTGFGLDASLLYDQRSARVTNDIAINGYPYHETYDVDVDQKQIAIPINIRYAIGIGSTANVFLFAGPQFGFNVGGDKEEVNLTWKKSNFSVNVGLGCTLLSHLQASVNYNIVCGKTGEINASNFSGNDVTGKVRSRYNAWQIGLAYYF